MPYQWLTQHEAMTVSIQPIGYAAVYAMTGIPHFRISYTGATFGHSIGKRSTPHPSALASAEFGVTFIALSLKGRSNGLMGRGCSIRRGRLVVRAIIGLWWSIPWMGKYSDRGPAISSWLVAMSSCQRPGLIISITVSGPVH